jgi:hypothetical protein
MKKLRGRRGTNNIKLSDFILGDNGLASRDIVAELVGTPV